MKAGYNDKGHNTNYISLSVQAAAAAVSPPPDACVAVVSAVVLGVCHVPLALGAVEDLLGVCDQAVHGARLLCHGLTVSVGPQVPEASAVLQ